MHAEQMAERPATRTSARTAERLAETEVTLARADRLWRAEVRRLYGPEGVLRFGYGPEGRGADGSSVRHAYEARRAAVASWRHERRPAP